MIKMAIAQEEIWTINVKKSKIIWGKKKSNYYHFPII